LSLYCIESAIVFGVILNCCDSSSDTYYRVACADVHLVKFCFPIIGVGIKRRKEKNKIEQLPDYRNQLEIPHLLDGTVHDRINKLNLLICCTDGVNNTN